MTFVQGGQTLLWQVAKTDREKDLVINSLGRKWELTFTTLVLFGGALFASFPKFYATSFGGAYWVWMLILFTFVLQAVSYEFRRKSLNLYGSRVYELFLFINGSVGIFLIGAAVGTFFTGASFTLDANNAVTWMSSLRGLEAALSLSPYSIFNICLGLFLVLNARTLGAMYLINNIAPDEAPELEARLRAACGQNCRWSLPFLGIVLLFLLIMPGFVILDNASSAAATGFRKAFKEAKQVAVECDFYYTAESNRNSKPKEELKDYIFMSQDTTYAMLYNGDDYQFVDSIMKKGNRQYFKYKPFFWSNFFTKIVIYDSIKSIQSTMDGFILLIGYQNDKKIYFMETLEDVGRKVTEFDSLGYVVDLHDQAKMLQHTLKHPNSIRSFVDQMKKYYFKQALTQLSVDSLTKQLKLKDTPQIVRDRFKFMNDVLIAGRNEEWMSNIIPMI